MLVWNSWVTPKKRSNSLKSSLKKNYLFGNIGSSLHAGSVTGAHGLGCSMECGILVPRPGIKLTSLVLQGRFLTTEPAGRPQKLFPCTSIRCPGRRLGPGQNTGNSLLLWPRAGRGMSGSPFHLPRTFPHKEKKP